MRIEGTYTFPGPIQRVFALLIDPDALAQAIPGCERLIQMGPASAEGALTFEMRLLLGEHANPYTMTIRLHIERRPTYVRLEAQGRGPDGPLSAQGSLDLVEQDDFTVVAYTFAVEAADLPTDVGFAVHAAQLIIRETCGQLAATLAAEREGVFAGVDGAVNGVAPAITTQRGQIVALPADAPLNGLSEGAPWAQRALWVGAGLGLGLSAIGLTLGLARWLGAQETDDSE